MSEKKLGLASRFPNVFVFLEVDDAYLLPEMLESNESLHWQLKNVLNLE